jgi:hypothetical protein
MLRTGPVALVMPMHEEGERGGSLCEGEIIYFSLVFTQDFVNTGFICHIDKNGGFTKVFRVDVMGRVTKSLPIISSVHP